MDPILHDMAFSAWLAHLVGAYSRRYHAEDLACVLCSAIADEDPEPLPLNLNGEIA